MNVVNGHTYVGSTSTSFEKRWYGHIIALKGKYHPNRYLQRAWDKYKQNSFVFESLQVLTDASEILASEQIWIDALLPEYNLAPVAGSTRGYRYNLESSTIDKMKEQRQDPIYRKQQSDKQKSVMQDLSIRKVAVNNLTASMARRVQTQAQKWIVTSPQGEQRHILNLALFCRENNLSKGSMQGVANGTRRHYKGWTCTKAPE